MARIRTIKPEFWEDENLANISPQALLLFIGIKNFADDKGVIRANDMLIKSKVFPVREDIRRQDVARWLQELIDNSFLVPLEYDGKGYYVLDLSGERIDRPQPSVIPDEIIDNLHHAKNSRSFANNRECSGTFENIPAGKERNRKGIGYKEKNTPNGVFEKKGELSFPAPAPESNSVSGQISESHPEPLSPPPTAEEKEKSSAKKEKERYAEFVTMTNAEYQALVEKFGEQQTREMIEILDNYKGAKGKTYRSDYRAILSWVADKYNEKNRNHATTTSIKELNDRKYGSTDPIKRRIYQDLAKLDSEYLARQVPSSDRGD